MDQIDRWSSNHFFQGHLVGASFGRSFYILDDITPLREVSSQTLTQEAALFTTKDAYWYIPRSLVSSQGVSKYAAENPPFGAVFTYYLKDDLTTLSEDRKEREKALTEQNKNIPFPGWGALESEKRQEEPRIELTIMDEDGNLVNKVKGIAKAGIQRVNWDLTIASKNGIQIQDSQEGGGFGRRSFMATPGVYTVTLSKVIDGVVTDLVGPQKFNVVPLRDGALEGASYAEIKATIAEVQQLQQDITAVYTIIDNSMKRVKAMQTASGRVSKDSPDLVKRLSEVKQKLLSLTADMNGSEARSEVGELSNPTPRNRMMVGLVGARSTYGPTEMHKENIALGKKQMIGVKAALKQIKDTEMPEIEKALIEAGAPWIEGQPIPEN
jgi:hypothetical protein